MIHSFPRPVFSAGNPSQAWLGASAAGVPPASRWLVGLAVVGLTPVVVVLLVVVESGAALGMGAAITLSAVQLGGLALVIHREVVRRAGTGAPTDPTSLGQQLATAESTVRHGELRLHELRSTIVGVSLSRQLLHESGTEMEPPMARRLQRLHDAQLARLERLVARRSDADGPAEVVDLDAELEPLVETLRLRGHRIAWRRTGVPVWGCPDDVAEIVHILLDNTARHAPGSPIVVDVRHDEATAHVTVSDRGPGIPAALLLTLFDGEDPHPSATGADPGLPTARRLARAMGGELTVDPRGPGASLTLSLPLAQEARTWHAG